MDEERERILQSADSRLPTWTLQSAFLGPCSFWLLLSWAPRSGESSWAECQEEWAVVYFQSQQLKLIFFQGLRHGGEGDFCVLAHPDVFPARQWALAVQGKKKKKCAWASSRKQQQKDPFHFFQHARSCNFRESGFLWEGGLRCTFECVSGKATQGKCRAQKVGLAAGCHFSENQVCCGNLCVSLIKTNKTTKTNTRASACV